MKCQSWAQALSGEETHDPGGVQSELGGLTEEAEAMAAGHLPATSGRGEPTVDHVRRSDRSGTAAFTSSETTPWDEFIHWAARFFQRPDYDSIERNYKLEIADHLRSVREAVRRADEDWPVKLKRAFGSPNNLTYFITHTTYLDWVNSNPDEARAGLLAIWDEDAGIQERLLGFLDSLPHEALAGGASAIVCRLPRSSCSLIRPSS